MKFSVLLLLLCCFAGILMACKKDMPELPAAKEPDTITPQLKATTIYLVRHAEKAANHPTNPDLSAAGKSRAVALKDSLRNIAFAAVYVSPYKRTQQTAEPLATAQNLPLTDYSPDKPKKLAAKIMADQLYKNVLIVGHSNTVLETIEALGAIRPIPQITDSDYNYLFKVTIPENGVPASEVKRYGN